VPKCVIFDVRSILGVQISSENFSLYTDPVGLRIFSRKVTTAEFEFSTTLMQIFSTFKTGIRTIIAYFVESDYP